MGAGEGYDSVARLLERIGCQQPAEPNVDALISMHEAFSLAIPYENLAIQLERPVALSGPDALARLGEERRGGWCYDLNGAFGLLLESCGFQVRQAVGAGSRETLGDFWIGSHLVLIVDLPAGPWLADVGYGDGPLRPAPLIEHTFQSGFYNCSLSNLGDGWWRYRNDPRASAPSFDFRADGGAPHDLERMHRWLSTDPESPYVQNLVMQRWRPDGHVTLRGRVLTVITPSDSHRETLPSMESWLETLAIHFDIALSDGEAVALWTKVTKRHGALFPRA
jgi:N-hydroxyarylamine O-acetyltransferase